MKSTRGAASVMLRDRAMHLDQELAVVECNQLTIPHVFLHPIPGDGLCLAV
jgi:hypothetical protein